VCVDPTQVDLQQLISDERSEGGRLDVMIELSCPEPRCAVQSVKIEVIERAHHRPFQYAAAMREVGGPVDDLIARQAGVEGVA
jgi:hypothetical protein